MTLSKSTQRPRPLYCCNTSMATSCTSHPQCTNGMEYDYQHARTQVSYIANSESRHWLYNVKFLQGGGGGISNFRPCEAGYKIQTQVYIINITLALYTFHAKAARHPASLGTWNETWRFEEWRMGICTQLSFYPWNQAWTCFCLIANGITWPATKQAVCTSPVWERERERER